MPTQVISPKLHWQLIDVLYDGGAGNPAVAIGRWDGKVVVAMRWNGTGKDNPIGNPQSRGLSTWFVMPDEFAELILSKTPKEKRAVAKNFFPSLL
jgi:hypothetical protein